MKLYVAYETDIYKTRSSQVLIGVFENESLAIETIKRNEITQYGYNDYTIEEVELNKLTSDFE